MSNRTLLLLLIAAVSLPGLARELPPEGGTPREYRLPNAETLTLDNRLKLTLVPFGQIPKVTISVNVQVGNLNEGDAVWLADLTGEMLQQGAGGRNADELAAAAAEMGGEIGVGVSVSHTSANIGVLSEYAGRAVALLADVVRRPAMPDSELARVRDNMLKNLAISATQPQQQADAAFRKRVYGTHPYGVGLPDPAEFSALDGDDVRAFHAANFGAGRTHIYIAGQFDRAAVVAAVRASLGDWEAGPAPLVLPPRLATNAGRELIDRPGAPQSTVHLGLPVSDPSADDYIGLTVLNTLLGGSFSSRITSNIREDKGYTYSPRSNISTLYRSGVWRQTADITTESTGAALREIVAEIRRLQNEAPPETELNRIKNFRTGTFVLNNATRGGLIGQLQFLDLHGLDRSYLGSFVGRLNAVTPAQIQTLAQRYLRVEDMTLVVVGDLAVVRPQIEALAELAVD